MRKVKWGVLSTAGIAQKQLLPAFSRANNAVVTAIATGSNVETAKQVADRFDIETVYDSYEKLLDDPSIDAVYIPLPNHLHKEWAIKAAQRGKHILCEKPAALTTEEVFEIKTVCEDNGVLFMEAFMYYFHPQHNRVKEIIDTGEIGEVTFMQAGFSFYLAEERRAHNIRMSGEKGGGSIYDIGCYAIHAIRNILGEEPESVHVHAVKDSDYGIDTDAVTYLTFPNGIRATFDSSFNLAMRNEYKVYGTKGSITVPRAFRPDNFGGEGIIQIEKDNVTKIESVTGDQYCLQVEHLSQAILDGEKTVRHTFDNTLNNMAVIDACYASIASNKNEKVRT